MIRTAHVASALGVVGFVAYFAALHALIVSGAIPALALALILAPWAVAAFAVLVDALRGASPGGRWLAISAALALIVLGAWFLLRFGSMLADRADVVLYAENVAFFAWLGALFARSLGSHREPLITRMARKVRRGDMPPPVVRYARGATIAWSAFFFVELIVSTVLFVGASRAAWSLFVNLLLWPCIGAMFAGEYAVRLTVLRDVRHESLWAGIRAFRERGDDRR